MDVSEEEAEMQAKVLEALNHRKEDMKQSVNKWNSEKTANEEYIAQMRANKEDRKREMEEMERMKQKMLEEEEEAEAQADTLLEDEQKPVEKKVEVVDPTLAFKSKEQVEMEEALDQRVRPLQLEGMDSDALKERVQEYWRAFSGIKAEKAELQKRFEEQDNEIKAAQERLAEVYLEKQAKKGVDMERLALGPGGKPSKHPPKMQMFSKHVVQKGNRSYEERQNMYDEGVDMVRPKMLESVWQAKFSAWMDDESAGSYLDGTSKDEEIEL